MEIFTIKVDSKADSQKLKKVLAELSSAKFSIIEDDVRPPVASGPKERTKSRSQKSKSPVTGGKFVTREEFEKNKIMQKISGRRKTKEEL